MKIVDHLGEGLEVEALVADVLRREGFVILTQNFRLNHLEIDLIALEGNVLCFIEVKARGAQYLLEDLESLIDAKKRRNITLAAEHFVRVHPEYHHHQVRFDYALVLLRKGQEPYIRYIKSAFIPGLQK